MTRKDSSTPQYWFAFLTAQPRPELDERVNIGIVYGNATAYRVGFVPKVPRLAGLVASDELGVYQAMLEGIEHEVSRGLPVEVLRQQLGTQLSLGAPIEMQSMPTIKEMRWLERNYLTTPRVPYVQTEQELIRRAANAVTESLQRVRRPHTIIAKDVRIDELYGQSLERFVKYRVPKVSRALRGKDRDLLVHSAAIEMHGTGHLLAPGVAIGSRAFYAYSLLEERIRQYARVATRRIGVLQPTLGPRTADVEHHRDWARHVWQQDADVVIDAETEDVEAALRQHADWVGETAA